MPEFVVKLAPDAPIACVQPKDSWILLPPMSISELAAAHVRHSEFQLQLAAAQAEFAAAKRGALSPWACRRRSENRLTERQAAVDSSWHRCRVIDWMRLRVRDLLSA